MNIAVFSVNTSFFPPVEAALRRRGHTVLNWAVEDSFRGGYSAHTLVQWADVVFFEFCQSPMDKVLPAIVRSKDDKKLIVARMHRIEMYNSLALDPKFPWDRVDVLFASANHVSDRFLRSRANMPKPKDVVLMATNIVDPDHFKFVERKWVPPYRIALTGNLVPKKRQYSAIQMMYDVKKVFGNKFVLDIVGESGLWTGYGNPEYLQNCLDLIASYDLKDVVNIYDKIPHDKMPDFYNRSHIILSCSNEEGTHVSIAEALSTGCIAFVGLWRGADVVYPKEMAWHFHSPMEFLDLCKEFDQCAQKIVPPAKGSTLPAISEKMASALVLKYGDPSIYDRMTQLLEEKLKKLRGS